jgi:hypothetical protein
VFNQSVTGKFPTKQLPPDRERLARRFPAAESLSVYDGQTLLGFVLACARPLPSYALDAAQQLIGTFETRKAAVEAAHGAGQQIGGSR